MIELIDLFPRIQCINLARRTDRWQRVQAEFARLGVADRIECFEAVERSDGPLGCAMSHLSIIEKANRDGLDSLFVFEDDIAVLDDNPCILSRALETLSGIDGWELFYLGGRLKRPAIPAGPHLIESRLWATHAYGIRRPAFEKVLAGAPEMLEDGKPIDVWYAENLISYCASPLLVSQSEGYSDCANKWIGFKTRAFRTAFEQMTGSRPSVE